jgi:hypothetical protein
VRTTTPFRLSLAATGKAAAPSGSPASCRRRHGRSGNKHQRRGGPGRIPFGKPVLQFAIGGAEVGAGAQDRDGDLGLVVV